MDRSDRALDAALATLRSRWGSAAVRLGSGAPVEARPAGPGPAGADPAGTAQPRVHGALALVAEPLPVSVPAADPLAPLREEAVPTGFPDLDAILGRGGLPRAGGAVLRGDLSSGKTTLALRCVAEAQARGAIAAWLDLPRTLDPVEAAARGVLLPWLLVLRPAEAAEGFAIAGTLLAGRAVDLLVIDLPARLPAATDATLRRLAGHTRRTGARLLVLEPASAGGGEDATPAEAAGVRLALERRGWIRLGRDVVGQRTRVTVVRDRHGIPGRGVDLEIHYRPDGTRALATQPPVRPS